MSAKILIVEDDAEILEFVTLYLGKHGFRTVSATDGRQGLFQFEREQPDLVLLDIVLPEIQGLELCRLIRQQADTPILFLSCKWETDDIVRGLEIGGNDYITKPFAPRELLARIQANLRGKGRQQAELLDFGSLQIDLTTYQVTVNGNPVSLYAKELQLLLFLARNPNRVFHVDELYDKVWSGSDEGDTRTVMVHISNLRRKIEDNPANPRWIQTVRGFGYRFNAKAQKNG